MRILELLFIIIILAAFMVLIYVTFFRKYSKAALDETVSDDKFSLEYLSKEIKNSFDVILKTNYSELNLNKYETEKNERNKIKLRNALKTCALGNLGNKIYVKDYIKDLLQRKFSIDENTINNVIAFNNPKHLSSQDKFEILMQLYIKLYDRNALLEMFERNGLNKPKFLNGEEFYDVTSKDIELVYSRHYELLNSKLSFADKLDIVSQRIYQLIFGLGVIDNIRDMLIDGVHCGTSGIPPTFYSYGQDLTYGADEGELPKSSCNSVWIILHGVLIHLSCLGFGTDREFERVAKIVYRNGNPGTLSAARGYIVNDMQDGSRVVTIRPPMAESWMFYIRKFDVASKMPLEMLYPYTGVEKLIAVVKWLVKGCKNIAITGQQNTGKSTFLMSVIQFLPLMAAIRVQEMSFELNLRKVYPDRDIATLKETATVSGQEGLDVAKKMDGTVNILGEVAQAAIASWAIQMGKVGAAQVMFTHHAKTADDLVSSFRDNMIEASGYNNEKIVEVTVANVLNFDIHLDRDEHGKRFVSRITEIIPVVADPYSEDTDEAMKQYFFNATDRKLYTTQDILVYDEGSYKFVSPISEKSCDDIYKKLNVNQRVEFKEFLDGMKAEVL